MADPEQANHLDECTPLKNDHHNNKTGGTFEGGLKEGNGSVEEPSGGGLWRKRSSRDRRVPDDNDESGGGLLRKRSIQEVALESLHHIEEVLEHGMEEIKEVLHEPVAVPVKPRDEGHHDQKLGTLAIAVLVFYKVSGGPFGCEPTVKAAGPFYALLGFIIFPLLWAVPEALVTAELGSAFPEPSGPIAWVEEAFGPQVSLLCGYFHWIAGATDNAIYPSLFLRYVAGYLTNGDLDSAYNSYGDFTRFLFAIAITTILAGINYSGLEVVGNLSMVVCIVSMSPFFIMIICAIPKLDVNRWFILPEPGVTQDDDGVGILAAPMYAGVMWRPLLNTFFWNMNSFDVGASFAGEIRDPEVVFPRAMFLSILFVVLGYLLPLLAILGATDTKQESWDAGFFPVVATEIAGPWLGAWTVFAAAISNVALFLAEMSGDAYQLMGMADRGLIPKLFTKRSRFGTPTNGIILGTVFIYVLSIVDFDQLVEAMNFACSLSMILEFSAFIKLRITDDDVERPYRIPLNTFGCILFVAPAMIFMVYLLLIASKDTYIYSGALVVFGLCFHIMQKCSKHYKWIDYVEAPKRKRNVRTGTPTGNISPVGSSGNSPILSEPPAAFR